MFSFEVYVENCKEGFGFRVYGFMIFLLLPEFYCIRADKSVNMLRDSLTTIAMLHCETYLNLLESWGTAYFALLLCIDKDGR